MENADLIPTPPPPPHISHLLETPPPGERAALKAKEKKLKERHEKARKEKERIERERREKERRELEKKERIEWEEREARRKEERDHKQKLQKEKAQKEKQERERQERERKERDRREKERKERERREREEKERERRDRERQERERREKEEMEAKLAAAQRTKNQELRSKAQTQKSELEVERSKGASDGRKDKSSKQQQGTWGTTHPDVASNEIETTATSFKKDNYEIVSTSIYDPRPRSRQYKKHKVLKGKGPGRGKGYKGSYRSSKQYKLPIRQSKSKDYPRSKSPSTSSKFNPSERNFFSEIQGYKVKPHAFETVKRDGGSRRGGRGGQEVSVVRPRSPPPPEPIFLAANPPRTPTPLLHTPVPSVAGPFTAFTTFSPAPTSPTPSHATAAAAAAVHHHPPPVPSQPHSLPNNPPQPRFSSFAPSPPSHPLAHSQPIPVAHHPSPPLLPAAPASLPITPDEMFEIFEVMISNSLIRSIKRTLQSPL